MSLNEQNIIPPVDRNLIKQELNSDRFIAKTNKGGNEIYFINCKNSPNVLREIGRLRELSFRSAGGGTGQELDLDDYDTSETHYEQLIVWNPDDEEVVGGYRFIECGKAINADSGNIALSTTNYFKFSEKFIQDYLPFTIELGRSWVQPQYQPSVNPRKGLFALMNIWDGLSSLVDQNPHIKYFFGKVTMYPDYNTEARDILLYFLRTYFPDKEGLLTPYSPVESSMKPESLTEIFNGLEFKEAYRVLQKEIRKKGESIPPLLSVYMHISPTMKSFGTAVNPDFGGVEETGILVKIDDVYGETRERHAAK